MLKDLHQSFRMNLNFILLSLCTTKIFASVWSSVFSHHSCSICEISLHHFSSIVYVFQKWLSTTFRKYWYSLNDKINELHMSMKIKTRMLVFLLLTVWSYLLMNLIRTQISHTVLLFSTMRINFSRIVILWRSCSFAESRWANH